MLNTNEMKIFIEKHQLIEQSRVSFYRYIDDFDGLDEFDDIIINLYKVQMVINYQFDEPVEYLQILLSVLGNNVRFAEYSYLVTLSGEVIDDSLIYCK
ncbi:hypothetical protein ACFSTH_07155 [Paenibacillus yanchengensis]|uniref:Uncharacterized protein n=1 Tax=Paenibacillus yanchengensis TaxID=2035833 RepID=A0ABW4YHZ2_9BACL